MLTPPVAPPSLGIPDDDDEKDGIRRGAKLDQEIAGAREIASLVATHYLTSVGCGVDKKRANEWAHEYQSHLLEQIQMGTIVATIVTDENNTDD